MRHSKPVRLGNRTISVNLAIVDGIWVLRLYKCRPYGAMFLSSMRFYRDAAPTGLKTTPSPHILQTIRRSASA